MKPTTDNYWVKQEHADGEDVFYLLSAPKKFTLDMEPQLVAIFFEEGQALKVAVLLSLSIDQDTPIAPVPSW